MRTSVSALLFTALIGVTSLASEAGLPDTSKMISSLPADAVLLALIRTTGGVEVLGTGHTKLPRESSFFKIPQATR